MTMGDKVFIDTNVLLYANFITSPFHTAAISKLQVLTSQSAKLWINRQSFREYWVGKSRAMHAVLAYNPVEIRNDIRLFEQIFQVADESDFNRFSSQINIIPLI
jgi:predicted nucleic acid-binding protein